MMSAKPPPQRREFMECEQLSKKQLNNTQEQPLKKKFESDY